MKKIALRLPSQDYFVQEALNVLRTNIQFCGQDVKTITLTSVEPGEGKTTLSLYTGKSLSELGKRVLVIDADMRKSIMAGRNANARNLKGLSELLVGYGEWDDCVCSTQYENMDLICAGQYPPDPVKLLNSEYFQKLLEKAKQEYDYVIIDTPPLGLVVDAAVIAAQCDSAMLVIGNKKIHYSQAQSVVEDLKKTGCNVLGVILNNASRGKGRYYYRKKKYGKY